MSVLARLGAILVAALVVGAVAFLVIRAGGAEIGLGPAATATATPTAAETATPSAEPSVAPSADPSVPSDAETLAILAEIEEQVIAIRGLEAADIGPAEIITRAELADELVRIFEEDYPPEEQRRDNLVTPRVRPARGRPGRCRAAAGAARRPGARLLRRRRQADGRRLRHRPRRRGAHHLRPRVHARAAGRGLRPRLAPGRCGRARTTAASRALP